MKFLSLALLILLGALSIGTSIEAAERNEGILVGRIAYTEGKLLRYVEEEKDVKRGYIIPPYPPDYLTCITYYM